MYAEPYPPAPEIELIRANGASFRLREMRGNTVLLFFGYTSCPDVCPTTLAELKQALEKLDEEDAKQVQVLFVTVDLNVIRLSACRNMSITSTLISLA